MIVKLLTVHHLEFLSLKRDCRGSSESTHVKNATLYALAPIKERQTALSLSLYISKVIAKLEREPRTTPQNKPRPRLFSDIFVYFM